MALDADKRIPDTTLPTNDFKDGDILYGSDMNRVVDTLKTAVNENYKDLKAVVKEGGEIYIEPISGIEDSDGEPITTVSGVIKWLNDNKVLNGGQVYRLRINELGQFEYYDGSEWKLATVGQQGEPGKGVAPGGTDGQALVKDGDLEYQTKWVDIYSKSAIDSKFSDINTSIDSLTSIKELVLTTSWSGDDSTGYSQTVTVEGITESDRPLFNVKLVEGDKAGNEQKEAEYNKITDCWTKNGSVIFYANEKTTIELTLLAKGV